MEIIWDGRKIVNKNMMRKNYLLWDNNTTQTMFLSSEDSTKSIMFDYFLIN